MGGQSSKQVVKLIWNKVLHCVSHIVLRARRAGKLTLSIINVLFTDVKLGDTIF